MLNRTGWSPLEWQKTRNAGREKSMDQPEQPPVEAEVVPETLSGQENYNLITDTVVGLNLRVSDNVFQAIAVLVCLVLGAAIGALNADEKLFGALLGGAIGMVVGVFTSGIFLMIYRGVRHLKGKHD